MKTLPISGKEWFGLFSFIVKVGIIFVCPALLAFHFCLRHTYSMAIDTWSETHEMVACVTIGYLIACGYLTAMGVVELFWHRRRQAMSDFAFAGLALFLAGFIFPPMGAMPR
jgi:hypothetical protein